MPDSYDVSDPLVFVDKLLDDGMGTTLTISTDHRYYALQHRYLDEHEQIRTWIEIVPREEESVKKSGELAERRRKTPGPR